MKHDLDQLMASRGLDAVLVRGKVLGNPPLIYLLNGAHLTQAVLIKKRGEEPTLIVGPMDRATAAGTGYRVVLTTRYDYTALLAQHGGDELAASVAYFQRIFEDLGVAGRLGCYGYMDQGYAYAFLSALDAATPDVEIVGEIEEVSSARPGRPRMLMRWRASAMSDGGRPTWCVRPWLSCSRTQLMRTSSCGPRRAGC